jgi:hypothetical protein
MASKNQPQFEVTKRVTVTTTETVRLIGTRESNQQTVVTQRRETHVQSLDNSRPDLRLD